MVANRLKKLRKEAGLTQKQLADKLNISPSTVAMYESGKRTPDPKVVVTIAEFFNVSTDYLLRTKQNPLTQEHLTNTYSQIAEDLGEDIQVMFHDITSFDEEELDKLKFAIEMIKRDKKKRTP